MKSIGYLLLIIPLSLWANCDLSTYRWQCNITPKLSPARNLVTVFCNGTPVFITRHQRNILNRYAQSNVIMNLKVNGEYFTGPCKLASK